MLKRIPLFVILLPVFVVVHVVAEFNGHLSVSIIWPDALKIFFAQICIFLFSRLFSSDPPKTFLITFAISLVYFFFPDLKDALHNRYPQTLLSSYTLLLPAITSLLTLLIIGIRRSNKTFSKFVRFLNVLLVLCIAADVPALSGFQTDERISKPHSPISLTKGCDTCEKPDVYFLLFDAYTSGNTLKDTFHFDNRPLDSFLVNKGFYVMADSRSNYMLTPLSVSSCLDMNYLNFWENIRSVDLKTYLTAVDYVDKTFIPTYFAAKGYELVNASIFSINSSPPQYKLFDLWDQNQVFARQHFFWKLYNDIGWRFAALPQLEHSAKQKRKEKRDFNVDSNLEFLKKTLKRKDTIPKFVYAHFLIPHEPYSRGLNGEIISEDIPDTGAENMNAYVKQVQYANGIIKDLVSRILGKAGRPAVIMIVGDHGYRFGGENNHALDFSNLNAVYFPKKNYSQFRQDQSLVNNFRVVLNSCFGESLPLLNDSSIYLPYK